MNVQLLQDKRKLEIALLVDISEYFSNPNFSTNPTYSIEEKYRFSEAKEANLRPEVHIAMKGLLLILLTFVVSAVHGAPVRTYYPLPQMSVAEMKLTMGNHSNTEHGPSRCPPEHTTTACLKLVCQKRHFRKQARMLERARHKLPTMLGIKRWKCLSGRRLPKPLQSHP